MKNLTFLINTFKGDSTPTEQAKTFFVIAAIVAPIIIAFYHHVTFA